MYTTQIISHNLPLKALAPYYHRERFLAMCRECPNYDKVWSCPPYDFPPEALLSQYNGIMVWGTKIVFDAKVHGQDGSAELAKTVMAREKQRVDFAVLMQEKNRAGSLALYGGGCRLCPICSRTQAKPCNHPEQMRLSLESLGYDVGAISEHVLNLPLLWFDKRLPEYMTLVTALLYNS